MREDRLQLVWRFARVVAAWSLGAVFALFLVGITARYVFERPISWIDEAVTILAVWSTFWTAALVLEWREHIAFDIIYNIVSPLARRILLLVGLSAFVVLMARAMPGMIDYTLFLWRETTDTLRLRLDFVYAVFPLFITTVVLRMLVVIARLCGARWRDEVARWSGDAPEEAP